MRAASPADRYPNSIAEDEQYLSSFPPHFAHAIHVNDGRAMSPHELDAVKPLFQRRERLANQITPIARVNRSIIIIRFYPIDLVRLKHKLARRGCYHDSLLGLLLFARRQ